LATENEALAIHTTAEAAVILRVTESWLKRRAAARRIPFTMLGGSYRFTTGHLAEIARMNEMTPRRRDDDMPGRQAARQPRASQRASSPTITVLRPRPRTGPRRRAA
jgi:excisionase family DNA binding protein